MVKPFVLVMYCIVHSTNPRAADRDDHPVGEDRSMRAPRLLEEQLEERSS
eukprot:COSAG03_NODE_808_length_5767_cov_6.385850_5_plen_50_part_00